MPFPISDDQLHTMLRRRGVQVDAGPAILVAKGEAVAPHRGLWAGTIAKSIQDIMHQDSGLDGDAWRLSLLCWMLFQKIIDGHEPGSGC